MSIENFESIVAKSFSIYNEVTQPLSLPKSLLPETSSTEEYLERILEIIDAKLESVEDEPFENELIPFFNDIKKEINFYIPKNIKNNYKLLIYFSRIMLYSPIECPEYIVNGVRVNIDHMNHTLRFTRDVEKVKTDVLTLIDEPKGFHVCIQMYTQQQPLDNNEVSQPVNHCASDAKSLYPSILNRYKIGKKNNDKE